MGLHVVMLTGDNERTARAIGAKAGVDEVIAGVLPDGKESVIRRLKQQGPERLYLLWGPEDYLREQGIPVTSCR